MKKLLLFLVLWCPLAVSAGAEEVGEAEFFAAVKAGDSAAVKTMLQAGAEVGILEDRLMERGAIISPLFYAVLGNDVEVARLLLEAGALDHPYAFFEYPTAYSTPLGDACSLGRFEIAQLMLAYGAAEHGYSLWEYHLCFAEHIERALDSKNSNRLQTLLDHVPEDWKPTLALLLHYREADPEIQALIEGRFPGLLDGTINALDVILGSSRRQAEVFWLRHPPVEFPMATSFLDDPRFPGRYTVDKAFDGDLYTAWVEGVDGPGYGEKIAFLLPHNVRGLEIFGGYGEQRYYLPNNRVKKAALHILLLRRDATEMAYMYWVEKLDTLELHFDDSPRFQTFLLDTEAIPAPVEYGYPEKKDTLFAVLEIKEVFPGTRWDDTCIAEIRILVDE